MCVIFWEFFTPVLVDGVSLTSEWPQVSSSLQDFSQFSDQPKYCHRLDSLDSSSNVQIFKPSFQAFRGRSKRANYNCHHGHLHLWQGPSTYLSFRFLWSSFCGPLGWQSPLYGKFSFILLIFPMSGFLVGIWWFICISKFQLLLLL